MRFSHIRTLILIPVFTLLSACATPGVQNQNGDVVEDWYSSFINGEVRLNCFVSCSFNNTSQSPYSKAYYDAHSWDLLAQSVSRVGYGNNLTYYYLGRAAEGLGFNSAARVYYNIAKYHRYKCEKEYCWGVNVVNEVDARIKLLDQQTIRIDDVGKRKGGR